MAHNLLGSRPLSSGGGGFSRGIYFQDGKLITRNSSQAESKQSKRERERDAESVRVK